ncbi:MAG: serine kinase [Pleurocapsa sp. SU_5_0]|nr:serine kinase [Pleurocapsa sp. SU_5_0]
MLGNLLGVGRFLIKNGREIIVDPEKGINEDVLRPCILGSAMVVLLQQRGFLVLHASCVVVEDEAIAFLGYSGSGKSTIASAFHREGYGILTEDVMAIDTKVDPYLVIPSFPSIKLRADSAEALGYDQGILSPLHPLTQKKVHHLDHGFVNKSYPLKRIYILAQGDRNEITPLSPKTAFIELVRHTRAVHTLKHQELEQVHFQQCATLVNNIPIFKLERKFVLSELPGLVKSIKEDLKQT